MSTATTPIARLVEMGKKNPGRWVGIKMAELTRTMSKEQLQKAANRLHVDLTSFHNERLEKLTSLQAPEVILTNERRILERLAQNRHSNLDVINREIRKRG